MWTEVRVGRPDEELARVATEYDARLIVLGRHGDRGGLRNRLGTTAERVLGWETAPVLVLAEEPGDAPRSLLVAVDDRMPRHPCSVGLESSRSGSMQRLRCSM